MADRQADGGPEAAPLIDLAGRVRHWRQTRGLTQAELAARAGFARSTLSKIENGLLSPTFEILLKLAQGFGTEIATLLGPEAPARSTGRLVHEPTSPGGAIRYPNTVLRPLAPQLAGRAFQSALVTFTCTDIAAFGPWNAHDTDDMLLVLSGRLAFHSEGYAPQHLGPGESLHFDGAMPHACLAVGPEPCCCLYAYAPRRG